MRLAVAVMSYIGELDEGATKGAIYSQISREVLLKTMNRWSSRWWWRGSCWDRLRLLPTKEEATHTAFRSRRRRGRGWSGHALGRCIGSELSFYVGIHLYFESEGNLQLASFDAVIYLVNTESRVNLLVYLQLKL